jgi:hypothetical protein
MNLSSLCGVTVEFGPRGFPLLDLLDDWAARVLKLYTDARERALFDDPKTWGVHDFIGSLYLRDAIERGIKSVTGSDGSVTITTLAAIDALLRSFTVDDDRQILRHLEPDAPREPWWWRRLPATGPIAMEVARIDLY